MWYRIGRNFQFLLPNGLPPSIGNRDRERFAVRLGPLPWMKV